MERTIQRLRKRRWPWILLALLLGVWFSGAAGWFLRTALIGLAPRQGRDFRIESIGAPIVADPATGAVVRVSAARLVRFAHDALGWKAYAIPPGTIPEWLTVAATVRVRLSDEAPEAWLPLVVRVLPDTPSPHLSVRLPAPMVNEALRYEGSFAHKEKTRSYALGHYNLVHSLRFDTVSLRSRVEPKYRDAVTFRRIDGQATGEVRFRVEENLFDARTTARVRRMDLRCDLDFRKYVDGLALTYKITLPKLDADIRNLAPMFEGKPVEVIRAALEDSIARPKNLERLSRRRLPLSLPLDTELDIEVFAPEAP